MMRIQRGSIDSSTFDTTVSAIIITILNKGSQGNVLFYRFHGISDFLSGYSKVLNKSLHKLATKIYSSHTIYVLHICRIMPYLNYLLATCYNLNCPKSESAAGLLVD